MLTSVLVAAFLATGPLTGCSSSVTTSSPPAASGSGPATVAGNRRAAQHEADRLLALVRVPTGATAVDRLPSQLAHSFPVTRPAADSVIDRHRQWQLNQRSAQVLGWLRGRRPAELTPSASWSVSGPEVQITGDSYSAPDRPAWNGAQVQIAVITTKGSSTLIRADALVTWLDPRPLPDRRPGPRLRVTIAGGCPARDRGAVGVTNGGADLADRLLPAPSAGAPTEGLICRYDRANGHRFQLRRTVRLTAARAALVARDVGRISLAHRVNQVRSCTPGDGRSTVIVLAYPGRPDVDLLYSSSGCPTLSNGRIFTEASLLETLQAVGA